MLSDKGLLLALSLSLLPGCWIAQNQAATKGYNDQVLVAQQRSAALERAVLEYEDRLKRLEQAIRAAGANEAEKLENLDEVNVEVNRLRGQIEVLRFEVDEMKRYFDELSVDLDRRQLYDEMRLRQLEKFLGVTPPPMPTEEPECDPSVEDCTEVMTDPENPEATGTPQAPPETPDTVPLILDAAAEHMGSGRPRVARILLENALKDHKDDPDIDEVRYRLAETWFNEGKFNKSVQPFQAVIDNHPKSDWAPWAMLRQGDAFREMGSNDNATLFYQEVIRLYPKTDAAKEAKSLVKGN